MDWQWLTTAPNPQSRNTGFDAGQRGWKLHCVGVVNNSFSQSRYETAMCGLLPAHGWSLDMFIEDKCERCFRRYAIVTIRDQTTK